MGSPSPRVCLDSPERGHLTGGEGRGGQALRQLSGAPVCLRPDLFQKRRKSLNKLQLLPMSYPGLGVQLVHF